MCRFLAYAGSPVTLEKLLYLPRNSLIRQSIRARELSEPLNGDGFGVGWYVPDIDTRPAVIASTTPAWSNRNLRQNASKIQSNRVFAHVRAATIGPVSESNCHPFDFGDFLFMHNGEIGGFGAIKRLLRRRLSDELYDWIEGQTDSEHFFALLLNGRPRDDIDTIEGMVEGLNGAFSELAEIAGECAVNAPSHLNIAITNGRWIIASRYASDQAASPPTLYYASGSRYECIDGVCRLPQSDSAQRAVLIVSEKLSDIEEDWNLVPPNHFVIVTEGLDIKVTPILAS